MKTVVIIFAGIVYIIWQLIGLGTASIDSYDELQGTYSFLRCPSGRCIGRRMWCDGKSDCGEGATDENTTMCLSIPCNPWEFLCDDGRCLHPLLLMDGKNDCKLGEDENATKAHGHTCPSEWFRCPNGRCLFRRRLCDGQPDCELETNRTLLPADFVSTDERPQTCLSVPCTEDEVRCPGGPCIPRGYVCDRRRDCPDGWDEKNCPERMEPCASGTYQCPDGTCLRRYKLCDGIADCNDTSDENTTLCASWPCDKGNYYRCPSHKCILMVYLCNGRNDCDDGHDEDTEVCFNSPCPIYIPIPYNLPAVSTIRISENNIDEASVRLFWLTYKQNLSSEDISLTARTITNIVSNQGLITASVGKDLLWTASNLQEMSPDALLDAEKQNTSVSSILSALDIVAANVQLDTSNLLNLSTDNLAMLVVQNQQQIPCGIRGAGVTSFNETSWTKGITLYTQDNVPPEEVETGIVLPKYLRNYPNARFAFLAYKKDSFFQRTKTRNASLRNVISSNILSASVYNAPRHKLSQPIELLFLPFYDFPAYHCRFWNYGQSATGNYWSETGCRYHGMRQGRVVCRCSHMTNFAILVDWHQRPLGIGHRRALGFISSIGLSLSSLGLAATLLTFVFFKKLRHGRGFKILAQLALSLLAANLLILLGLERTEQYVVCCLVAALIQYFLLAAFGWMTVQVVHYYLKFIHVMGKHIHLFVLKAALLAWGLPLIIVMIVAGYNYKLFRGPAEYCWLAPAAFRFSFMLPVGAAIAVNLFLFMRVLASIWFPDTDIRSNQSSGARRTLNMKFTVATFVVSGVTWVSAYFAIENASVVFQYVFCICNSLQGLLIFIFHIARDPHVRREWFLRISGQRRKRSMMSASTSHLDTPRGKRLALSLSTASTLHSGSPRLSVSSRLANSPRLQR